MLLRFRTRNFRSIRDEVELSFAAANISDLPEAVMDSRFAERGVLRAAAIYGANASGKSNVLRAIRYMQSAVEDSQRFWEPEGIKREPFLLDPDSTRAPTLFEVTFSLDDVRYEYGFELDSARVKREWLYAFPTNRRQVWFERDGAHFAFGKFLVGDNAAIQGLTRANSLFLSAAAQNNHDQLVRIYHWFSSKLVAEMRDRGGSGYTAMLTENAQYGERIRRFFRAADLGIERFEVSEARPKIAWTNKFPARRHASLLKTLSFVHRSGELSITLPEEAESEGTRAYFGLLGPIVETLDEGGILVIDEITASLHPLLARNIVQFFNSPAENPHGAQLIFTTHDTTLLEPELLRRDQVWFTEKDDAGATHLYPLTDFKPRRGENVRTGYLQGRYGGVPFLSFEDADEPPVPK
jgi:AAA15 family ATPase/GTPase